MNRGMQRAALTFVVLGMALVPAYSAPAKSDPLPLAMLGRLEPGSWDVHTRVPGGMAERICLRNGRGLIQLRHPAVVCQQLVVDDRPGEVTVQYTCQGKGYGRTRIRQETPRLVQIESQGIADGLPFSFSAEARRVGACAG